MPRIERLKQNTPEWHRWRLQGIGASDAPVVMGDAPFRTRRYLWSVKTGLARESAVVRRHGAVAPSSMRARSRLRAPHRHPDGAAVPGARRTGVDAGVARRAQLRRRDRARNQVPLGRSRSGRLTCRTDPGALLRAGPAPAGSLAEPRSCTTGRSTAVAGPWSRCTTTANTSRDCWRPKPPSGCGCWNSAGPMTATN